MCHIQVPGGDQASPVPLPCSLPLPTWLEGNGQLRNHLAQGGAFQAALHDACSNKVLVDRQSHLVAQGAECFSTWPIGPLLNTNACELMKTLQTMHGNDAAE